MLRAPSNGSGCHLPQQINTSQPTPSGWRGGSQSAPAAEIPGEWVRTRNGSGYHGQYPESTIIRLVQGKMMVKWWHSWCLILGIIILRTDLIVIPLLCKPNTTRIVVRIHQHPRGSGCDQGRPSQWVDSTIPRCFGPSFRDLNTLRDCFLNVEFSTLLRLQNSSSSLDLVMQHSFTTICSPMGDLDDHWVMVKRMV